MKKNILIIVISIILVALGLGFFLYTLTLDNNTTVDPENIIKDVDIDKLQKISVNIYPNMLKLELKQDMDEEKRDEMRATYIREELK